MPYFRRDNIDFYFEQSGSGRPLIFSHGLGGNISRVQDLQKLSGVRLIIYDNRAHGRSRPLGDPAKLTFEEMADDMAALLAHLSISGAVVGGVSMGAGIALSCALQHPSRVEGLVLSRAAWLDSPNPPNLAFAEIIANLVEEVGPEQALAKFEQTDYSKNLSQTYPAAAKSLHDVLADWNAEALVACYRAIPASTPVDSLGELANLSLPTLVMGNRNDPFHPFEFAEALAMALPKGELQEIPSRSENLAQHEHQFRHFVNQFLASLD